MALKPIIRSIMLALTATVLCLIALHTPAVTADPQTTTLYVDRLDDTTVNPVGACTAAANDCTLRGALGKAVGDNEIHFVVTGTIHLVAPLTITVPSVGIVGNNREALELVAPANAPAVIISSDLDWLTKVTVSGSGSNSGQDGVRITGGSYAEVSNNEFYYLGGSGVNVTGGHDHLIHDNVIGAGTANGQILVTCIAGNHQYGVAVSANLVQVYNNTIGCNALGGVVLSGTASFSNTLQGNFIGVTGNSAHQLLSNGQRGVLIFNNAHDNAIGRATSGANLIAGNNGYGVEMSGTQTMNNRVVNNLIGLYTAPNSVTQLLGNTLSGLYLHGGVRFNVIGGSLANGDRNYISGNAGDGILIDGLNLSNSFDTAFNTIKGNFIGLDANGDVAHNANNGIELMHGTYSNTIGSGLPDERNVISGNYYEGVYLNGANWVWVYGNYIGTDPTGQSARPNETGLKIDLGAYNTIGSALSGYGNLISGNDMDGLSVTGAHDNAIIANIIGATISATEPLPNNNNGIRLVGGAHHNQIGSLTDASAGNLVAYNQNQGILVSDATTANNTFGNNLIVSNKAYGIWGAASSHHNTFGGGHIASNGWSGVKLSDGAHDNLIRDVWSVGNGESGLRLEAAATTANLISNTWLMSNTLDGLSVDTNATGNWWTHVYASHNGGLDIDTQADVPVDNTRTPPFPAITLVAVNGANVTVYGTATASTSFVTQKVEVYAAVPSVNGAGGVTYLGSADVNNFGLWSLSGTTAPGSFGATRCFVAFQTSTGLLSGAHSSTEYGPNNCSVFLPATRR